jgi:hypothetical protein
MTALGMAAAVMMGTLTIAPAIASADDCISGRVLWASDPPQNHERKVLAKLADVIDSEQWVGYADLQFIYVPPVRAGNLLIPAHLTATDSEIFSDRLCPTFTSGCVGAHPFTQANPDTITINIGPQFLQAAMNLEYHSPRWSFNRSTNTYTCINNNTVAFTAGDRTFVLSLSNFEKEIIR